jgi:hypothetical protein
MSLSIVHSIWGVFFGASSGILLMWDFRVVEKLSLQLGCNSDRMVDLVLVFWGRIWGLFSLSSLVFHFVYFLCT